jgi:hypothetical protein
MEEWRFPPRYDAEYLPSPGARYWFPVRETMPPGDRERAIVERLKEVTRYAWDHAPFYRRKWEQAGFHPDQLRSLEDFEDKVPVITKQDLRAAQASAPPFGDYVCVPDSEIHHVHGTSGTTGRPTAFASAAPTGTPSPTTRPASCTAWASVPAIRCSSPPSSACTWGHGARSPARSGCAPNVSRSARARRA